MKYFIGFLFILLGGTGLAQTYTGKQKDINAILAKSRQFSLDFMAGDYQAMTLAYTTDGKIFPNNKKIIAGRTDIAPYWKLPPNTQIIHHAAIPEELFVKGKTAYDYGYYEGKTQAPDGTVTSWKGKYVIVWKKVKGEWLMYLDIWNRVAD